MKQSYSVTRAKTTWKPRVIEEDLPLFFCRHCNTVFAGIASSDSATYIGTGRSPLFLPPYLSSQKPQCCGFDMAMSTYIKPDDLPKSISLDYLFIGGQNNSSLKILWSIFHDKHRIEWILLKTFTGMQVKYIQPGKRSPIVFAFADEDAYAYCDKDPCEECVFRCKRGFVAYVSVTHLGVVRMPLDRMSVIGSSS